MHQPELHLAEALAAQLRRQVRRPEAALLDALLDRLERALEGVAVQVERLERPDVLADDVAHPVQVRLELGLGREVPHEG